MKRFANIKGDLFYTDGTIYVSVCNPNVYYIKGQDEFEELPMPKKEDKTYTLEDTQVRLEPAFYGNGCIAIIAIPIDAEGPYDYFTLTVNLNEVPLMSFSPFIYADINNVPESLDLLVNNGLARKLPMSRQSGFVTYPAIAVDLLKMCVIAPEKFEQMTRLLPELERYYSGELL